VVAGVLLAGLSQTVIYENHRGAASADADQLAAVFP